MYYEINVSLNGKHFFATHERSLQSKEDAKKVFRVFQEKFTEDMGYEVTCTVFRTTGEEVDF